MIVNKVQFHGIVHFFFTYIMKGQVTHAIKPFPIIFFTYGLTCVKIEISVRFNICQRSVIMSVFINLVMGGKSFIILLLWSSLNGNALILFNTGIVT